MPAKSHKCTLIPGDIEAARGAKKLVLGASWRALCPQLGGREEGGGSQHSGGLWRPQNRNGEVTPGDRQRKAAAGRARGEHRGPRSPPLNALWSQGPQPPPRTQASDHQTKVRWVMGWTYRQNLLESLWWAVLWSVKAPLLPGT